MGRHGLNQSPTTFWEEIYIIKGRLRNKITGEVTKEGMYCCQPPGMLHGPSVAETEVLGIEFRYYK